MPRAYQRSRFIHTLVIERSRAWATFLRRPLRLACALVAVARVGSGVTWTRSFPATPATLMKLPQ